MCYLNKFIALFLVLALASFGCGRQSYSPPIDKQTGTCPITANDPDGDCIPSDYEQDECKNDADCDDNGFQDNEDPPNPPPAPPGKDEEDWLDEAWSFIKEDAWKYGLAAAGLVAGFFAAKAFINDNIRYRDVQVTEIDYTSNSYLLFHKDPPKMDIHVEGTCEVSGGEERLCKVDIKSSMTAISPHAWQTFSCNAPQPLSGCKETDIDYNYEVTQKDKLDDGKDHIRVEGSLGTDTTNSFISNQWLGLKTEAEGYNRSKVIVAINWVLEGDDLVKKAIMLVLVPATGGSKENMSCFLATGNGILESDSWIFGQKWQRYSNQSCAPIYNALP